MTTFTFGVLTTFTFVGDGGDGAACVADDSAKKASTRGMRTGRIAVLNLIAVFMVF